MSFLDDPKLSSQLATAMTQTGFEQRLTNINALMVNEAGSSCEERDDCIRGCDQDKANTIRAAEAVAAQQRADLVEESRQLAIQLAETAEAQWLAALALADQGRDNWLAQCDQIDNSTLAGSLERTACRVAAHAAHATATGAATTAYGLATAAIAGEIAAFELARLAGIQLALEAARAAAAIAHAICVQGCPDC